jgi:hypothetical protein
MSDNCDSCRFSDLHPDNDSLFFCRRRCPVQVTNARHAMWPVVKSEDWCGEFEELTSD